MCRLIYHSHIGLNQFPDRKTLAAIQFFPQLPHIIRVRLTLATGEVSVKEAAFHEQLQGLVDRLW
jgi:hypothetical protein